MKTPFKAYSVIDPREAWLTAPKENREILESRWSLIENEDFATYEILHKDEENWQRCHETIRKRTEPFQYTIDSVCPITGHASYREYVNLIDDGGSNWLALVCERAKKDGIKMYLSGMGADEVFSDYGFRGNKHFGHSNFGGLFPKDLSAIFPWNSFYGSSMESYLAKEEYVGGSFGLEARYPYLDTKVVQEFLNLTQNLKNSVYKSVIDNYLTMHNYPFARGEKRGF
jgi:asparagine synthetase B (glutamine-hydrolysing)